MKTNKSFRIYLGLGEMLQVREGRTDYGARIQLINLDRTRTSRTHSSLQAPSILSQSWANQLCCSGLAIGYINFWQIAFITLATGPFIVAAGGISNIFLHRLAENIQDGGNSFVCYVGRFLFTHRKAHDGENITALFAAILSVDSINLQPSYIHFHKSELLHINTDDIALHIHPAHECSHLHHHHSKRLLQYLKKFEYHALNCRFDRAELKKFPPRGMARLKRFLHVHTTRLTK